MDGAIAGLAPLRLGGPILYRRGSRSSPSATTGVTSTTARRGGRTAPSRSSRTTCWPGARWATSPSSEATSREGGRPSTRRERLSTDVEVVNALAGSALAEARAGAHGRRGAFSSGPSRWPPATRRPRCTPRCILAQAYAGLGDADHAIAWLRRYTPRNDLHFQLHLRCDPPFAPIETDPRFRSLLLAPRPAGSQGC